MEKVPQPNKAPKKGLTPKTAVLIGAGLILPHITEKASPPPARIQEDTTKTITVEKNTNQTVPEDTVMFASIPTAEQPTEALSHETKLAPEAILENVSETPEKSEVSTPASPTPVEIKKAETAPLPMSIELESNDFNEHLKVLLESAVGKKARMNELEIIGSGNYITVKAQLQSGDTEAGFSGNLQSEHGKLMLGEHTITGNWFVRTFGEKLLTSKVKTVLDQLKTRLEDAYKNTHPNGIENFLIVGGKLKINFKK